MLKALQHALQGTINCTEIVKDSTTFFGLMHQYTSILQQLESANGFFWDKFVSVNTPVHT